MTMMSFAGVMLDVQGTTTFCPHGEPLRLGTWGDNYQVLTWREQPRHCAVCTEQREQTRETEQKIRALMAEMGPRKPRRRKPRR